jgi:hypothetical protein
MPRAKHFAALWQARIIRVGGGVEIGKMLSLYSQRSPYM